MARTMTIAALRAALAKKQRQVEKLHAKRGKLVQQLDEIDREIAVLTGDMRRGPRIAAASLSARAMGRTRPQNAKTLIEFVQDALAGVAEGMRVKDAMSAVQQAGYESSSKDFYGIVAAALREGPFVKLRRGVYALKAAAPAKANKAPKKAAAKSKKAPRKASPKPKATKKRVAKRRKTKASKAKA